jgi:hypothetical protein
MNVAVITARDIAAYLAKSPRKKQHKSKKIDSPEKAADTYVRDFSALNIHDVMRDKKGVKINIEWIIKELVKIYATTEKDATKVQILDRLQDFIVLGAIQDAEMIKAVRTAAGQVQSGKKKTEDPFLKIAKGA